jgi:Staphylococcal nuclease homologue
MNFHSRQPCSSSCDLVVGKGAPAHTKAKRVLGRFNELSPQRKGDLWQCGDLVAGSCRFSLERSQPCADGWPAGRAATEHLRALIGERHVTCEPRSVDRYGRTVAVCHVDGRDLGADTVTDGHAWAFVRYSRDYVEEEREAAAVRAGIHGHTCQPAWQWRAENRTAR